MRMAQLAEEGRSTVDRARLLLRQRPSATIALSLVAGLIVGAAGFGFSTAQGAFGANAGVVIERDDGADEDEETATAEEAKDASDDNGVLVVDVSGAVASPAVVELEQGSRVQDAIAAAGGLTEDADISALNRASVCTDGQKIYVPHQGEAPQAAEGGPTQGAGSPAASSLVNINSADEIALDALPGVGPSTARAIIEDREANGPFASIEDLMRVSGIGEKKFEKLKSAICV